MPESSRHRRYLLIRRIFVVIVVLIVVAFLSYLLVPKLINIIKKNANSEKVLTINDLNKPSVELDSATSDASVENLTEELQTKISKQIIAKENPFDTVDQLAGILSNTTNKTRQDQLTGFLEDFLAKHEDTLRFEVDSETPDQAQVNYWKAMLYAKLVYNYQFVMQNKFTGSDGKPIDTTKEQLRNINLYLALANDPVSHSRATEEYKYAPLGYTYSDTDNFLKMRDELVRK